MTKKQKLVLETIEKYEKDNGRYPRLCDLTKYIEQNNIAVGKDRRNIIHFVDKLEKEGKIKRYKDIRTVTKEFKVTRIKVL